MTAPARRRGWPPACASCRGCRCWPTRCGRPCCGGSSGSPGWRRPGSAPRRELQRAAPQPVRRDPPCPSASPSWSRATRACRRPSSPRSFWPWSGWAWTSRSSPCATRPTAASHPLHGRSARRSATCPSTSTRSRGGCCARSAGWRGGARSGGCCGSGWRDLARDPTPNRGRRLGQAWVLAAELPERTGWLHVHYLHTPASVARYAAILRGLPYSVSAHAKDVWTIPDWEKREKIAGARWLVTCSRMNSTTCAAWRPGPTWSWSTTGWRPSASRRRARAGRHGGDPRRPVGIVCVARAVEKKGLDVLLDALARLPAGVRWRFEHIGGGPLAAGLEGAGRAAGHRRAGRLARRGHPRRGAGRVAAGGPVLPRRPGRRGRRPRRPAQRDHGGDVAGAAGRGDRRRAPSARWWSPGFTGLLVPPDDPAALAVAIAALEPATRRAARHGPGRAAARPGAVRVRGRG